MAFVPQAEASERPVVEQVLLADEARTALLEEEACLLREMDDAERRDNGDLDGGCVSRETRPVISVGVLVFFP